MGFRQSRLRMLFLIIMVICNHVYSEDDIPSEQFKINQFQDDIWHPHIEKSHIDDDNFVLVDTYKDHLVESNTPDRLKGNDMDQSTKELLDNNYEIGVEEPDTLLPGKDPTEKGPFN